MKEVIKYIKEVKKGIHKEKIFVSDFYIFTILEKYQIELDYFLYCKDINYSKEALELLDKLIKYSKESYNVSKKIIEELKDKDNSIEFIGVINFKTKKSIKDLKSDVILVLDGIEIPGNLGTIFRTCDATNIKDIIMINNITKLENYKVLTSSRGMQLKLNICNSNLDETINYLNQNNYEIFLGEPENGKSFNEYNYQNKLAIVFGNERFGIDKRWYDYNHFDVFIPMKGEIESLNVAIAASVILYQVSLKKNL